MTVRMVAGPAGALCVDDAGSGGSPVLFVHSLAGRAAHWSAALAHCRPHRRALAFDQRGHGRSAPLERHAELAIETLADDVRAVADACGLRRFVLVGHSLGGGVALAFAGAYPDRVERLLLLDPIGDGTQMPAAELQPFLDRLDSPAYLPPSRATGAPSPAPTPRCGNDCWTICAKPRRPRCWRGFGPPCGSTPPTRCSATAGQPWRS